MSGNVGNFPQTFTYLALIDDAITLDEALDRPNPAAPARRAPWSQPPPITGEA